MSVCHRECTTAECLPLKTRPDKIGRRSRPKIPSQLNLRHTREFVGEVTRRQSLKASVDQHRQLVVDPIRMHHRGIKKSRRHAFSQLSNHFFTHLFPANNSHLPYHNHIPLLLSFIQGVLSSKIDLYKFTRQPPSLNLDQPHGNELILDFTPVTSSAEVAELLQSM